ncbi:MAG: 50S ribosomal protein L10 [Maricaulaceae bacterium]
MDRVQKTEAVETLKAIFADSGAVVVARYAGLTVAEMTGLRGKLRDVDATLKVVKNRLAKIALQDTDGAAGASLFTGPAAILFARDPVAASKIAVDYAKENEKFILVGGILGPTVLDPEGVKALATMPSLDEMRAKLLGLFNQPATKLVTVLNKPAEQLTRTIAEPGRGLAGVINAYAQKETA